VVSVVDCFVFKLWALFSLFSNGTFEFNRYGAPQVLQRALMFDTFSVHLLDFAIPKRCVLDAALNLIVIA